MILGANGAGKTTTLRAVSGMIETTGSVELRGEQLVGKGSADIVRRGLKHVPQGRGTFPELTVEDNLRVGAFVRKDKEVDADMAKWFEIYPVLHERRNQRAGSLSGGEQQMLAVSRALMSRPEVVLLDEPSLGLAPIIVKDLFDRFRQINRETGTTMLIVEQNAQLALGIANRGYVLETGEISVEGAGRHAHARRRHPQGLPRSLNGACHGTLPRPHLRRLRQRCHVRPHRVGARHHLQGDHADQLRAG